MKSIHINPLTTFSKTIIAVILATTFLVCLFSCKKHKDNRPLIKKWHLVKEYDTVVDLFGPSYTSIYDGKEGDYYLFEKNDSLTKSKQGYINKTSYKFDEDKMQIFVSDLYINYKVLELTDDKLEIWGTWARGSHTRETYHIYFEK